MQQAWGPLTPSLWVVSHWLCMDVWLTAPTLTVGLQMDTQGCPLPIATLTPRETEESKFHPPQIYGQEKVGPALLWRIFVVVVTVCTCAQVCVCVCVFHFINLVCLLKPLL